MSNKLVWVLVAVLAIVIIRRLLMPALGKRRGLKKHLIRNRRWVAFASLTVASIKMYARNRTALFFSLFFPLVFISIFGLIFKNNSASLNIDLTNQSQSQLSTTFVSQLNAVKALKIKNVSPSQGATDLDKGDADLTVLIPAGFGSVGAHGKLDPAAITAHYNESRPGNGQAAAQLIEQIASGYNDAINHTPTIVSVDATGVKTKNLTYIDFLLPGMIALSIMQIGIFSVAFAFVSYKTTGMLRRLQATPTHPSAFLAGQGVSRLIMAILQTILLAAVGIMFFSFHLATADYGAFLVLALLGSAIFQAIGFAIAGWAKNEDQAQPVAQLIQFPMMFLSGTFFPRSGFPHALQVITGYLPLTYLADAMRQVANNNASLWAVRGDLIALVIWGIIAAGVAVKVFSWE